MWTLTLQQSEHSKYTSVQNSECMANRVFHQLPKTNRNAMLTTAATFFYATHYLPDYQVPELCRLVVTHCDVALKLN